MVDADVYYSEEVTDEALHFISSYTGNHNLPELREHVLKVKKELTEQLHVYKCIQKNMFLFPRIEKHPTYTKMKEAFAKASTGGASCKVADIGCCFGTDTRKMILDGCSPTNIYSLDVHPGYWNFGIKLYTDEQELKKVHSLFDDVAVPEFATKHADLKETLNYAYAGAVLHVLAQDEVDMFNKNVHFMLVNGGTYFGSCVATSPEPVVSEALTPKKDGKFRYLHTRDSLEKALKSVGFANVWVHEIDRMIPGLFEEPIPGWPVKKILVFSATK